MVTYRHRLTGEDGESFVIEEVYPGGFFQTVDPDQGEYLRWINDGNTPETLPYQPPPPPPEDKREWWEKRRDEMNEKIDFALASEAIFEFLCENRSEKLDAVQAERLAIKAKYPKPEADTK